jgi:hypothetical protein
MNRGVPQKQESLFSDSSTVKRASHLLDRAKIFRVGPILFGLLSTLIFASSAFGATATVGLGSAARPSSVLGGSTIIDAGHYV